MGFDLNQLNTFFVAARTLNYTEAARRLCVTQSAVSHSISKLERSAGTELFKRTGRKLALTTAGKVLLTTATRVFQELESAQQAVSGTEGTGVIRLGATVEFGTTLLIKYLKPFLKRHPDIHVDFYFSHELLRPLLNDDLDLAIDCRDHRADGVERRPLFREEYAVIAAPAFVRAHNIRNPADLARCQVLSLDKDCSWWGNFLDALPGADRPRFGSVTQINHIRGIVNAAAEELGVGFVPKYCVLKELKAGALVNVFPRLELLEDRFAIYQKTGRAGLARHRLLTDYLLTIKAAHFARPHPVR